MIDELTKKLIEDSMAMLEGKKLDPVGKRDSDVDNDGDVDDSDEYLAKRRDAIAKSMKKEGNKFTMALNAAKKNGDKEFEVGGETYQVKEVEDMEHDNKKKEIKELDKEKEDEKKDVKEFFDLSELQASKLEPRTMKMIDMMNDMMKFKHGSKEFKQKKAEIDNFLKKNAGK
jgi:hypothetical protein